MNEKSKVWTRFEFGGKNVTSHRRLDVRVNRRFPFVHVRTIQMIDHVDITEISIMDLPPALDLREVHQEIIRNLGLPKDSSNAAS